MFLALFRQDLRKINPDTADRSLSRKKHADADAAERAEKRRAPDELLRQAGLDPRPARRDGRARKDLMVLEQLQREKIRAIRNEQYERAAELRDKIRKVQQGQEEPQMGGGER